MVKNLNKNSSFIYSIITVILAVFIVVGVVWAWTEPSIAPPGGNVPAPLNTGSAYQEKAGDLWLKSSLGITNGLIVENGSIGIGISSPSQKLDVDGQIHATGDICTDAGGAGGGVCLSAGGGSGTLTGSGTSNFIPIWTETTALGNSPFTVDTVQREIDFQNYKLRGVEEIDPVFNIWGKKYTSYMPDFIGQKVEVVGQEKLQGDKLEIDLAKEPEGSDLWLFWQVVDRESIISFISPQDNASLYAHIYGSKFVIKLREGEKDARFSYRLIGTRLDHADDINNLYDDQSVEHFIDIDSLRK